MIQLVKCDIQIDSSPLFINSEGELPSSHILKIPFINFGNFVDKLLNKGSIFFRSSFSTDSIGYSYNQQFRLSYKRDSIFKNRSQKYQCKFLRSNKYPIISFDDNNQDGI